MNENVQFGPLLLIEDASQINKYISQFFHEGLVPFVSITRNQFPKQQPFTQISELKPEIEMVIFSVAYNKQFIC